MEIMTISHKHVPKNFINSVFLTGFVPDIFKAYFNLKKSFRSQLKINFTETRLLAYSFFIAVILFLERLPLRVMNHSEELGGKIIFHSIGIDLFASIFFVPLFIYFLSAFMHVGGVFFGGKASFFETRLAFFWSTIVVSPVLLITGLMEALFIELWLSKIIHYLAIITYAWIFSSIFCSAQNFSSNIYLFFILVLGYLFLSLFAT